MNTLNNTNIPFPDKNNYLFLDGPNGKLEVLVYPNKSPRLIHNSEITTIICHPHPLHSGTMDNKVVHTIHKAAYDFGAHTVRFNFRGVGRSEGKFDNSVGELDDLNTVINWVQLKKPKGRIILAGFSFGAYIAYRASQNINCLQLITIAPAVQNQNYDKDNNIKCPWLLVQGEADEIIPPELVFDYINTLKNKPDVIKFPNTGHFFHGELINLKEKIIAYLQNQNYK